MVFLLWYILDNTMRATKCLSLDEDLLQRLENTKGKSSVSERVNVLLRTALELEQQQALHAEAEVFFASDPADNDRGARKAFQAASIKSLARED